MEDWWHGLLEQPDPWQVEVLHTKGNMVLRSGRQVGKSTIIALKAAGFSLQNPKKLVMVIAYTEKQANLLFTKILNNIVAMEKRDKRKYISKPKPTKHIINLMNGSTIHCYAAGDTGFGIMGFTIDLLIADEAAWIKEEVWNSIVPALAVTKGLIWLLSTPWLREGYYADCFKDPNFTSFHQSSEDCPRISKEFLEEQKKRFTKTQYEQMYKGEFVDNAHRIYSDDWIDKVCKLKPENHKPAYDERAIGIDVAGTGDDESTYEGLVRINDKVHQFYHEVVEKMHSMWFTAMMNNIRRLNNRFDPKFGIDGDGLGSGVVSSAMNDFELKRKVVDLKNSRREIDKDGKQTSRSMKEAMYMNMLEMGESGDLLLFDTPEIRLSLRSIISKRVEGGQENITGAYAHITEGLTRACWLLRYKELNMRVHTINV